MNTKDISFFEESNGDFIVVQDFRERSRALREGYITQEEVDAVFGEKDRNGNFNTEDGKAFLEEYRDEIPFFTGGSELGTIEGHSRFESAAFLQQKKLGNVRNSVLPNTQDNYDYGHIFEEAIAQRCAKMLREKEGVDVVYIPCEFGYVNPDSCLTFLAHPDGFLLDRKTRKVAALVEVKTAQANSEEWKTFLDGRVPESYQDQAQGYMKTIGINGCWFFVHNKNGSSSDCFRHVFLPYDEKRAEKVLADSDKFVWDTAAGIMYDSEFYPDETALVYRETDPALGYKKLPRKCQHTLEQIERLEKHREALNEEVRETNSLIRQTESEMTKLKESLYSKIGNAPGGMLETSKATYILDITNTFSLTKEVKEKAAEMFPEEWKAITELKPVKKSKLRIIPKETSPKEDLPEMLG